MTEVDLKIEKLLSVKNITKAHEITIQHALEISPLVKEQTIGPDIPVPEDKTEPVSKEKYSRCSAKSPLGENSVQQMIIIAPSLIHSSMENFDVNMMNAAVLLREAENKRKKHIRQIVNEMQEKQINSIRTTVEGQRRLQVQKHQELLDERRRNEAKILMEAEKSTRRELEESEQQMDALRLQLKRQMQIISFQGVAQYQSVFRRKYEAIATKLVAIDRQGLFPCGDYNRQLKQLVEMFEKLTGKIKSGECGAAELNIADELCKNLSKLLAAIDEDLKNFVIEKEKAQQQKVSEEVDNSAEFSKQIYGGETKEASNTNSQPGDVTTVKNTPTFDKLPKIDNPAGTNNQMNKDSCPAFYNEIHRFYIEKENSVKPLQLDENMKKFRFACQKAINIPLNAITAVSPEHLQDKFEKIFYFLNGQPHRSSEGQVSVSDHPLGRTYCILLTARLFVNQGETAISSNPQAAFAIASVVVSLWKLVPDFGKLFLATIFKELPFLVPIRGQSVVDHNDLKRQAGITRLYSAVMITCGRKAEGPDHPYGIEHAWRWLINFSYLDPLPDISATLIMEMLQTVGHYMCQTYGKQFTKLLLYIQTSYFQRLSAVDEGGPKTRLEMLLINYMNQGQIPAPHGTLSHNFW